MKTIIAGSRNITDIRVITQAVKAVSFKITEVVSGCAKGVDSLGEEWARVNNIPIKRFFADWKKISSSDAWISENRYDEYNILAGFWRNKKMAEYGDVLIAIQKNKSRGTEHMIKVMRKLKKPVFVWEL